MEKEIQDIKNNIKNLVDKINSLVDAHSYLFDSKKPLTNLNKLDNSQIKIILDLTDRCFKNVKESEENLRYIRNILGSYRD